MGSVSAADVFEIFQKRSAGVSSETRRFAKPLAPMLQSSTMQRWFFAFFYFTPCLLADGTG
jgi:hypothetical protein